MKEVAILLLAALFLNGCGGSSSTTTQAAAANTWQAAMLGGIGQDSGFSFITQFTVGGDGTLSISYFQFLNSNSAQCFPVSGGTETGQANLQINSTTNAVTGTLTYTVQSGGNTLTLNGTSVTGTETGTTLTGGSVTGNWTLTGGTGCSDPTGGSFTMMQH